MRTVPGRAGSLPRSAAALLILALAAPPAAANAQLGGLKKLKDKAKQKVEQRIERSADRALESALDRVECVATDRACIERAKQEGKEVQVVTGPAALEPGKGAWANYDFQPGDRILYADDFTGDAVGDFPRRMGFQSGAVEVVEWQGGRWLRATEDSRFFVVLPEVLPDRFTMEFDYSIPSGGSVQISFGPDQNKRVEFGGGGTAAVWNQQAKVRADGRYGEHQRDRIWRARVLADGRYLKVYLDDRRILNVPNADMERSTKILFYADGDVQRPTLFGNFRVAAGGRKLYDALAEKGRVATQGIYFDFGSDRIRPESTPTLQEIGQMLREHPDLSLTVEGHTDSVGDEAANQRLSERRAAAVVKFLAETYGIEPARLEAKGHGESKPVASNDTPEGRQQNRRVELVKRQ